MASFLVFLDTIGVSVALLGGNTPLCLLMGLMTLMLYVKVNPILFGDYDRKQHERMLQRRKLLLEQRANHGGDNK